MRAIAQSVSASLNPIPSGEHFRRSRMQLLTMQTFQLYK